MGALLSCLVSPLVCSSLVLLTARALLTGKSNVGRVTCALLGVLWLADAFGLREPLSVSLWLFAGACRAWLRLGAHGGWVLGAAAGAAIGMSLIRYPACRGAVSRALLGEPLASAALATLFGLGVVIFRARRRIFVEDFTGDGLGKAAISGATLAACLRHELAAITAVHRTIDEALPSSDGRMPKLEVAVEDVGAQLESTVGAVPLDRWQRVVTFLLGATGLLRGPHLRGRFHREGASRVLTVELLGGDRRGSWRMSEVDLSAEEEDRSETPGPKASESALAYRMVRQMADALRGVTEKPESSVRHELLAEIYGALKDHCMADAEHTGALDLGAPVDRRGDAETLEALYTTWETRIKRACPPKEPVGQAIDLFDHLRELLESAAAAPPDPSGNLDVYGRPSTRKSTTTWESSSREMSPGSPKPRRTWPSPRPTATCPPRTAPGAGARRERAEVARRYRPLRIRRISRAWPASSAAISSSRTFSSARPASSASRAWDV